MADPFSIIALISTTFKAIVGAKIFTDSIQYAPRSVRALSDELSTIGGLLRELGHLANRTDELNLNRIVRDPLVNCDKIARQIEQLIRPYVKQADSGVSI